MYPTLLGIFFPYVGLEYPTGGFSSLGLPLPLGSAASCLNCNVKVCHRNLCFKEVMLSQEAKSFILNPKFQCKNILIPCNNIIHVEL